MNSRHCLILLSLLSVTLWSIVVNCGTSPMDVWKDLYSDKWFRERGFPIIIVLNRQAFENSWKNHHQWPVHELIEIDALAHWYTDSMKKIGPYKKDIYGTTTFTSLPNQDQRCLASLYTESRDIYSNLEDKNDRCSNEDWWNIYDRFTKCWSPKIRITQVGSMLIGRMLQHMDHCVEQVDESERNSEQFKILNGVRLTVQKEKEDLERKFQDQARKGASSFKSNIVSWFKS